ncbi:hypothetical protein N7528_003092 [Penicillium herquei]|nr:hypothetical protein N7528_003092 [Penicillium herquei]
MVPKDITSLAEKGQIEPFGGWGSVALGWWDCTNEHAETRQQKINAGGSRITDGNHQQSVQGPRRSGSIPFGKRVDGKEKKVDRSNFLD